MTTRDKSWMLLGLIFLVGIVAVWLTRPAVPLRRIAAPKAAPASALPKGRATIPVAYQGEWNLNRDDCGADDNRVLVRGDRVLFFDSTALLDTVEVEGANRVAVIGKIKDATGEYELRQDFILSADGQQLTLRGGQGAPPTFYRCPAASA